ncbi:hypothetical protein QTI24_04030 [Variovorax sp. J22P240]|uniref:hypothetical protein n=1 Tax=Variovorax sp. J22P240 TaxID=3053514 RepID=UPI002577A17D|nr:hypothetical protein [Variovorax sp. J22P240]MDL9997760.1 hypothetical protein [Variovorax sp. J22P240]
MPSRSTPRVVASGHRPAAHPVAREPFRSPAPVAPVFKQPAVFVAPVEQVKERSPLPPLPIKTEAPAPVVSPPQPVREVVQAVVQPEPEEAPATVKPMRTLEEVRADLARLRASAKERHAQALVPVRRDVAFAPTDFMDFAEPATPPREDSESSFEATAYLDFTTLKPREST